MVFPPIHWFQGLKGRRRLSDIEFLAKKEFDGKLVKNEGMLSVAGDLATLTASSGKDMYLARAKVMFYSTTATAAFDVATKAELSANAVVLETARISWENVSDGGLLSQSYTFENIGHKVAATQIIKLEVTVIDANTDVEGFVECFEEDTGVDPTI